ncbi:MAG TPA: response regulator [Patescibacteria group bacterium]|nr:response regulator [Patescibacteria group bacterium]
MKKILIIEDSRELQRIYATALEEAGFSVIQAFTGQEGLSKAAEKQPNMIVLDIMLPGGINGFEVLQRMKLDNQLKNIPVVVLTNLTGEEHTAKSLGVKAYIMKTDITLKELVSLVKKHTSRFGI